MQDGQRFPRGSEHEQAQRATRQSLEECAPQSHDNPATHPPSTHPHTESTGLGPFKHLQFESCPSWHGVAGGDRAMGVALWGGRSRAVKMRYPRVHLGFLGSPRAVRWGAGLGQEERPSPGAARRLLKRSGAKVGGGGPCSPARPGLVMVPGQQSEGGRLGWP